MENADALDLSKENIQPLKRGRNTAQLGLALQAQSDTALQQMLLKKQEWYEMQIRAYEGSDPLELWCDYISWVEQSFPKHGPEANLSTLLYKCCQAFKDAEKYKNDIRYVRIWIKFIEMQIDCRRIELYKLMESQGIGLACAEFYQSWAYEYQSVGDWKQAEQIFRKGASNMAQPAEDFHAAHQQFLASYVFSHKNMNNEMSDEIENHAQADHRLPMASLRPMGKKSAAPNVRVGSNVRSQLPGVVPAVQGSSGRTSAQPRSFGVRGNNAGPVTVFQQHGDLDSDIPPGPTAPFALPVPQSLNKENIVKPGPWTGQGPSSRKHQPIGSSHVQVQKQPGFEVHKDEDLECASSFDLRSHGLAMPNVLQPRKALEDGFHDAIAIFEEPNPFCKPMYRKNEVYAGGKELQLEELHALDYFRKRSENERISRERSIKINHGDENVFYDSKSNVLNGSLHAGSTGVMQSGESQDGVSNIHEHLPSKPCLGENPAVCDFGATNYHQPQQLSMYGPPMVASSSAHCTELSQHDQPQAGHRFQPSNQSMHNQSMTLHTKLAMHEVDNLWGSPTVSKAMCESRLPVASAANMYQPAFHIMRDDSLPPPVHENPPHQNPEQTSFSSQTQFCKPKMKPQGTPFGIPSTSTNDEGQQNRVMDTYPAHSPDGFASAPTLFSDPMTVTSYLKHHNGFQVYQEEPCSPVPPPNVEKFKVFCDDESVVPTRILSAEKGDLSSSGHTSASTVQKIAKEKENIHKFPQADIELLEDCGVAPMAETQDQPGWQHPQSTNFSVGFPSYAHHAQNQMSYVGHNLHGPMHPTPVTHHETLLPATSATCCTSQPSSFVYHTMQSAPSYAPIHHSPSTGYNMAHPVTIPHEMMYAGPPPNNVNHEPMEDDATVSAGPSYGVNMSETGITEAFFFPKMGAASTPYQTSPKKSRAVKTPIDFNSSLYRCEQSWPDEEEGADTTRPDAPKTVPPLKLFRIKNDEDQLSAIMESSKEKYQSICSVNSRNSISAVTQSRYGPYTTERQNLAPPPCLNDIEESAEPSSSPSSQEAQVPQVQGPDIKQMTEIGNRLANRDISPFDNRLLEYFLFKISFPLAHHAEGYHSLNAAVPTKRNNCLNLNGTLYSVNKILGEGAYAKVLKAVNTSTQREVALKIQKPGCRWEYYICREIQHRLSQQNLASSFMPADQIFVYNNGSIIVTDLLPFGTLLNLVNKVVADTKRPLTEPQVFYILEQVISAVQALHECKIIHGDLKPDNILLRAIPAVSVQCIQLIDFGRSIDMSLMPEGMTFDQIVMTDTFTCIEMRTGRPWTYQTDLFNLANTAHCLLFGDYMKVLETKHTGRWAIQSKLPRHVNSEFWGTFFDTLLNIESCDALPDLETLRADIQSCMNGLTQLQLSISALGRMMLSR